MNVPTSVCEDRKKTMLYMYSLVTISGLSSLWN